MWFLCSSVVGSRRHRQPVQRLQQRLLHTRYTVADGVKQHLSDMCRRSDRQCGNGGMDACGVCNGDNSTCSDCSGVPNGGKVLDACGLCNGDGTSCLAVTSVSLDYVPAQTARTVKVGGAGLNGAALVCVAINQATNAATSLTITQKTAQEVTISLPALAAATYTISCRLGSGQALANSTATVTVYASSATVTSVTPTQFTISGSTQSLAFVGSGFVVNHTYCHVKVGAAAETTFLASVTDGSNAACDVTHPATSSQILVALSLNKVDKLASDTTVTAQAAAPTATAAFTNSGEKVVVTFSAPVATASLTSCAAVFQDVSSLGSSATCSFQSRTIMLIESTTAAIDSSLTLKTGAVKAFGETYAIAASGTITLAKGSNPLKPTGMIRGPSQLGTCSDLSVDALGSFGGGGRALTYTWAVSPSTGLTLTGQSTASLSVTGTMSGSTYTVTVTVCNFMNECDTTPTLTVQKLTTAIPDVYVTAGVDTSNVLVSEGFELTANAKLTSCVDDTLLFSWTFSDSRVNINTVDQTRRVYNVRTGDLPGDVTVTATVTVSLASDTTRTVAASISLVTKSTALVASIKGSDTVTIGTQTGQLSLDGSGSLDPDGASGSLKYEWSCVEQLSSTTATCLDPTGATFPTSSERTTATLTMATSRLSGGKTYVFTLTVSKSSGGSTRSNSASVTVVTIEGTPPKVLFRDLAGGNKINANNVFTVRAIIESSTTVTASWESVITDGYGFVDVTNANNLQTPSTVTAITSTSFVTVLSIKAGILQRGTNYRFKCTVTDANGKSSVATEDVYVYNGVTSCSISAPSSYQQLDSVSLSVSKCYTDSDGIPLTYTLYQVSGGSDTSVPLSTTQDSGQFTVTVGPKADASGKNVFAVQVCANKGGCMIYKSGDVTVTAVTAAALVAKQTSVISNTDTLQKEGKPLQAAVALGIYIAALQQSISRRRRSADEALDRQRRSTVVTTTLATLQINLVNTTLNTMQLKETEANTLLGVLGALPATTVSDSDMLVITSFYVTITNYFQTNSVKMTASSVEHIHTWTAALAARSVTGSDVTDLTSKITKAARLGFQLDESQTFTFATSTRKYMFIIPGSGHISKDTNSTTINFGDTLRKRFASWACSSGTCEGVGVEITSSNTDVDPYSTTSDDIKRRSSDVVDILLIDPVSGDQLSSITGLSVPVSMTFVVTRPQSGSTQSCKYWNTLSARWETDGLSVSSQSTSSVTCTSDHLTGFAAFGESTTAANSSQTGLIVGIVFGGIIAMCVIVGIAIVIALAVNKKNKVNIVEAISPPLGPEP
ncbi:mucin-19-like [Haliotis rubra]|uniref:mucin-19-like n=1 Tax=Haliotis rubra TaxID=36100 RepID=UPI001EE5C5DA|nr:mucin-19-like [Haliotis rubra]